MNRTLDEVLAFACCAKRDANIERVGRAVQVIAVAQIDHPIRLDLSSGDQTIASDNFQPGKIGFISQMKEKPSQVGGMFRRSKNVHGKIQVAVGVLDRCDLHANSELGGNRESNAARQKFSHKVPFLAKLAPCLTMAGRKFCEASYS